VTARPDDEEVSVVSRDRRDIAGSLELTVQQAAALNEYRVSQVRAAAYVVVVATDLVMGISGIRQFSVLKESIPIAVLSLLALIAVRPHWYRPWFRFAIPVGDAIFLWVILTRRFLSEGVNSGLIAATVLGCALFASTGGVRFDWRAAVWTNLLATMLVMVLVGPHVSTMHVVYVLVGLSSIAYLNFWMSAVARRSMEGDRSQNLLRRFLPDVVVKNAFRDPALLLGQPRSVEATIIVTDLRGFTAASEKMSPADVLKFLSEVQGALASAVHANGGVVDKFMGDGMLAVFGVHESLPNHAGRALSTAREMARAVEKLNQGRANQIKIGVGIHSGPVVAGCMGTGDRLEFTVIGDTVNTASRLEAQTKELGVQVLASERTIELAKETAVQALGEVTLRGRAQPTRVFGLA
jgi:adenylate cyclase